MFDETDDRGECDDFTDPVGDTVDVDLARWSGADPVLFEW